ncbi:MAG: hypothetical protein GY944_29855 [bacterium]|nr:hypothetical protein [bacterium]
MGDEPGADTGDRTMHRVGLTVFAVAAIALYARLYFGIDFTDDAFYVALPYAFALGHRPLVDELAAHQFAGIALVPFVKAYLFATGSQDGLVLFARHLYFAAALACAAIARSTLSALFGRAIGTLCAAVSLAYVPFMLPTVSYNTLAYLGLFAGSMLLSSTCLPQRKPWRIGAGVLCVALAGFAYPPVSAAGLVATLLALVGVHHVREPQLRSRALAATAGAGMLALAIAAATIFSYGDLGDLARIRALSDAFAVQGGGLEKLLQIVGEALLQWKYFLALGTFCGFVTAAIRWIRDPRLAAATLLFTAPALLLASWLFIPHREPFSTAPFVISALGGLAAVSLRRLCASVTPHQAAALRVILIPSLLSGAVVVWASANGLRNGALGLLPACLVAVGTLPAWRSSGRGGAAPAGWPTVVFALGLVGFLVLEMWTHVYRDQPIHLLTARMESGAWQGIYTSEDKQRYIQTLERDIAHWRGNARTVLFMDYFPGGYLLTDLRPKTPALWLFPWNETQQGNRAIREIYARELGSEDQFPDLLVRMRCVPTHRMVPIPIKAEDPLARRLADAGYRRVEVRDCHRIMKRRRSAPTLTR